ncbi:MAG: MBL fold metallo-hydrolase [Acidimicrobiales bacterium]
MTELTLTILGTAAPFPVPGNVCSGYLVRYGKSSLWLDAGTGTLAELQRHVSLVDLSALWISHVHADHFADLPALYYAYAFGDVSRKTKLPVIGPRGWAQRVSALVTNDVPHDMGTVFDVLEHGVDDLATVGEMSITGQLAQHNAPSYALRVEAGGRSVVYSGDTGRCPQLTELSRGADLLLCEVGCEDALDSRRLVHCTPEDAGKIAADAGVGHLLLTHLAPRLSGDEALQRAATAYEGPVTLAQSGMTFPI